MIFFSFIFSITIDVYIAHCIQITTWATWFICYLTCLCVKSVLKMKKKISLQFLVFIIYMLCNFLIPIRFAKLETN